MSNYTTPSLFNINNNQLDNVSNYQIDVDENGNPIKKSKEYLNGLEGFIIR